MRHTTALLAGLLLLAACGDDSSSTTTTPVTAATTTTTITTTTQPPATTPLPHATTTTVPDPIPLADLELTVVQVGGSFAAPIFLTVRSGDDRLYVANQNGVVQSMTVDGEDVQEVIDISSRVAYGGERGLLGLVFHPADPERMFLHYSRAGSGATTIEEYRLPEGSVAAGPEPVRTILSHSQPAGNHNGGMITFGPDRYLYIGL